MVIVSARISLEYPSKLPVITNFFHVSDHDFAELIALLTLTHWLSSSLIRTLVSSDFDRSPNDSMVCFPKPKSEVRCSLSQKNSKR